MQDVAYCDLTDRHESVRRVVVVRPWILTGVDLGAWGDAAGLLYLPLEKDHVLWQWKRILRNVGFSVSEVDVGLLERVDVSGLRAKLVSGHFSGMYLVSALTMEKFGYEDVVPGRVLEKPVVTVKVKLSEASVVALSAAVCVVDFKFDSDVSREGPVDVVVVRALVSLSCAAWVAGMDAVVTEKRCAFVVASVEAQFVVERSGSRLMERWLCCDCSGAMEPMCSECKEGTSSGSSECSGG